MPDLVKVGYTTRDPSARAGELSSVTGIPTPFLVVFKRHLSDCEAAESYVHVKLEGMGFRVSMQREFFRAPISDIIEILIGMPSSVAVQVDGRTEFIDRDCIDDPQNPWLNIWNIAESLYFGLGDVIKDVDEARRNYSDATKLGCIYAYYRLAAIAADEAGGKRPVDAIRWAKQGVERGNYACHLNLATIYSSLAESDNTRKAIAGFFRDRAVSKSREMESEIFILDALVKLIADNLDSIFKLDPTALLQLRDMRADLTARFDLFIDMFEKEKIYRLLQAYRVAKYQIDSLGAALD